MKLAWRSARLNAHPGLYLRAWGKWYRIIRAKDFE